WTLYLPTPVQLLRRRRAPGARLAARIAPRPEGDRHLGGSVPRREVRYATRAAGVVQLGLLQERSLPAHEIPGRGRCRLAASGWRPRVAVPRIWRTVDEHRLYGTGPAQPTLGRGVAHRQGVDQQRLVDGPRQLRRGEGR